MIAWIKKQEIFLKLSCLLMSVLLWMYVLNAENQDVSKTYKDIAVTLQNQQQLIDERGLIVTSGQNQFVSVTLTGKRENLISAENPGEVTAAADVSVISDSGTHNLLYNVTTPAAVSVKSKEPEFIKIDVERFIYKSIPLTIIIDGNSAENHSFGEIVTDFEYVTVSGAESHVKNVESAVAHINADGLSKTTDFDLNYIILDKNGDEITSEYIFRQDTPVTARLLVTKNERKKLTVDLVSAPGIDKKYASVTIQPEYITVTAIDEILSEFDEINLGSIDLSQISDGDTIDVPIKMPNGVRDVDGTETVKITVSLDGIIIKDITPQNINFNFTSEKYTFEPVLTSLKIKLKGHKSILDGLSDDAVLVKANFREDEIKGGEIAAGWHILSTEIVLPQNLDVAVVEKGTLIVEVTENKTAS